MPTTPTAYGIKDGKIQAIDPDEADYELPHLAATLDSHINLIPMQNAVQAPRLFYGARFYNQALALQNRICREWGGCKPYVPKRPAERHAAAVGQQLAQGSSLEQAFKQAGISRRQGYRILSRPLVKPR